MKKILHSFSDLEHLELVAQRIAENSIDITSSYQDWMNVTFACASLGESAREAYQTICSQYSGYSREECDAKFSNCLRTGRGSISLGTLIQIAQDHGIDTSLPKGRRPKSTEQKEEEQKNRVTAMGEQLKKYGNWRFNTLKSRPEWREGNGAWKPVNERDLRTFYCRLLEEGIRIKISDVEALIYSRDFSVDFDPVIDYLESLPEWNPDTDPDYIHEFFVGHLEFGDPEYTDFYDQMFHKWFVEMIKLWLGITEENPIMPVFSGPQHIGKTYFVKNILPPQLQDYLYPVNPSKKVDKDFVISLSEVLLMFLDEFSIGSSIKSDAYKFVVTSSRSNERDSFGHFREWRDRRASLVAATNNIEFIRDPDGNRRYLSVNLVGTKNLKEYPLPYDGAYSQALYLLHHGYQSKPNREESRLISEHNKSFMIPDDCEEALVTLFRKPEGIETPLALSAGDIMNELNNHNFRGNNAVSIGRAMTRLGFDYVVRNGKKKYIVVKIDFNERQSINVKDAEPEDAMPF